MVLLLQLIALVGLQNLKNDLVVEIDSYEYEGNFSKVHALEWEWQSAFETQCSLARTIRGSLGSWSD